jgi:hypothetical protein
MNLDAPSPEAAATAGSEALDLNLPPPLADGFLDSLTGTWRGVLHLGGMEFEACNRVEWVLNHQFIFGRNRATSALGVGESQELWQPTPEAGVYRMWWADAWGNAGIAEVRPTTGGWIIAGSDPLVGGFRNTVLRAGPDELEILQESGPDEHGAFTRIGDGRLRRAAAREEQLP